MGGSRQARRPPWTRPCPPVGPVVAIAVGLTLAAAARPAAAEARCAPVVELLGPPGLSAPVATRLRERRLALGRSSRCGRLVATVAAAGARIQLTIVDPEGRRVERTAEDLDEAATAIESWVRRDVSDPLLGARLPPSPPSSRVQASGSVRRPRRPSLAATAGLDAGATQDGGLWAGAHAGGCAAVGPVCVGGLVRYARDTGVSGDTDELGSSRDALSMLATADLAIDAGRLALVPGLELGQSSIHARLGSDREDVTALVAGARLAIALELSATWAICLQLTGELAPRANVRLGDEADDDDPDGVLAGAPRWAAWAGLGMRYGAR